MKKFAILSASVALLALGACVDADDEDDAADETAVIETETTVPAPGPTVTETSTTVIEDGDDEPSVEATIGPEPEATVRSD